MEGVTVWLNLWNLDPLRLHTMSKSCCAKQVDPQEGVISTPSAIVTFTVVDTHFLRHNLKSIFVYVFCALKYRYNLKIDILFSIGYLKCVRSSTYSLRTFYRPSLRIFIKNHSLRTICLLFEATNFPKQSIFLFFFLIRWGYVYSLISSHFLGITSLNTSDIVKALSNWPLPESSGSNEFCEKHFTVSFTRVKEPKTDLFLTILNGRVLQTIITKKFILYVAGSVSALSCLL